MKIFILHVTCNSSEIYRSQNVKNERIIQTRIRNDTLRYRFLQKKNTTFLSRLLMIGKVGLLKQTNKILHYNLHTDI